MNKPTGVGLRIFPLLLALETKEQTYAIGPDISVYMSEVKERARPTGYKADASLDKFCKSANARPIGSGLFEPPKPPLPVPLPPRPPLPKPRDIVEGTSQKSGRRMTQLELRLYNKLVEHSLFFVFHHHNYLVHNGQVPRRS